MVVGASALFWASRDYAVMAPDWDGQVRGIAYNPSHIFTEPRRPSHITPEQIDRDLAQLSTHHRPYPHLYGGWRHGQGAGDRAPLRHDGLAGHLDQRRPGRKNEKQIELGIKTALANRRVIDRVIVGNETQLRGDVSRRPAQRLYPTACARRCRRASR